jgi:hypothetical protein
MNQYPGSRSSSDPDSRSEQPQGGHRFGGGLHGLPKTDIAQDPDYPAWRNDHQGANDSDFVEWQKDRFRAGATGGDTSVGTEDGMDDDGSSKGTSPDTQTIKDSNLTGSEQSTSAVAPDDDERSEPGGAQSK